MNTDTGMTAGRTASDYRVKPSLKMALIVVVIYSIYLYTMEYFSGVPYTDVAKSVETMTRFALIPIGGGALLLAAFALISGWWVDLWHDKYKLDKPVWLGLFAVLMIIGIIASFASGNIFSNSVTYVLVAAVAMACVGFTEEILFRGIVLRGARGSGYSETKVMLIVAVSFGVWHLANVVLGSPLFAVLVQVIQASIVGGAFYMIFRKSGLLIVPMILHAFHDFALFTKGIEVTSARANLALITLVLPLIYLILLVVARNYINVKEDG